MRGDLGRSVVRVLDPRGQTAGTGFAAGVEGLVLTCAHVVADAHAGPGEEVELTFGEQAFRGLVAADHWRPPDGDDVAVLRVDTWPDGLTPLSLMSSEGAAGASYETWGFPDASPIHGLRARGMVTGPIREPDTGQPVLQLERSGSVTTGYSGGPVVDLTTGHVIGMIHSITRQDQYGRQSEIALATPAESLREACPDLRLVEICPYRSLEVFDEEHARFLFGRDPFIRQMLENLRRRPRFLAVLGPSGSGKSSVVRAGLLPAIAEGRVPDLAGHERIVTRPAGQAALERRLPGAGTDLPAAVAGFGRGVVLVLDQFEEVFLEPAETRGRFIAQVCRLLDSAVQATIVLIMRDDFYSRLAAEAPELIRWIERGLANVPAQLDPEDLMDIVREPARAVRLRFEDGLAEAIVDDAVRASAAGRAAPPAARGRGGSVAQSTVLPLVEFTLTQLWRARSDGMLLWRPYLDGNRVSGALTAWADDAILAMPPHLLDVTRALFTSLVHLGDERAGVPDTRRKRRIADLYRTIDQHQRLDAVLAVMTARRLLVTAGDEQEGDETVELIHDVLLREWGELAGWLEHDRKFLTWRQWLEPWVAAWRAEPELTDRLLRGGDLATAEGYLAERPADLDTGTRAYIEKSVQERDKALRERAEVERALADHRQVTLENRLRDEAADAAKLTGIEPAQGLLQAVSVVSANLAALPGAEPLGAVRAALRLGLQRSRELSVLPGTAAVRALACAPDDLIFATGGDDRLIRLWRRDGVPIGDPVTGHTDSVNALAFSPDGRVLASGGEDGLVLRWSRDGRPLARHEAGAPVHALAWTHAGSLAWIDEAGRLLADGSPLGRDAGPADAADPLTALACAPGTPLLVVGTLQGTLHVVHGDVPAARGMSVRAAHDGFVAALAVHPDGSLLASGGAGGAVRLWSWSADGELEPFGLPWQAHDDAVHALAFSADGDVLSSGSADAVVRLWDVRSRRPAADPMLGHDGPVTALALSRDCTRIVSGSADRTVRVWQWRGRRPMVAPAAPDELMFGTGRWDPHGLQTRAAEPRHREHIYRLAISRDGQWLATASDDRTVRVSDVEGMFAAEPLTGHEAGVRAAAFSPDGRVVASAGADGTVRLWNRRGTALGVPVTQATPMLAIAYDRDGARIAAGDAAGAVTVLDASTLMPLGVARHGAPVNEVVFHPGGSLLYSAGDDGLIRGWSSDGQPASPPLSGHDGPIRAMAVSADGSLLATGGDDSVIRLWDDEGRPVGQPFIGHDGDVLDVTFTPDGSMLLSAARDGTVRLWALDGTQLGDPLEGHAPWATSVVVTPDGRHAVSAGAEGMLRTWTLGGWRDWVAEACRRLRGHPLMALPSSKPVREFCARANEEAVS
ncbi:trypsin-like peptidase domain-containing protein [Nonomuraea sp. NPDC050394]|uniref:nSTAND1 domain-containing NTPase n=1 Tax=Nonomuraea sp. NPDC050394 TaxID=3364363 RepID=UPI00379793C8